MMEWVHLRVYNPWAGLVRVCALGGTSHTPTNKHKNRSDEAVRHDHPLFTGGVQVVKVPKAGHFLHQERPEEVNRLMLDWFGRHEAGTGV